MFLIRELNKNITEETINKNQSLVVIKILLLPVYLAAEQPSFFYDPINL